MPNDSFEFERECSNCGIVEGVVLRYPVGLDLPYEFAMTCDHCGKTDWMTLTKDGVNA